MCWSSSQAVRVPSPTSEPRTEDLEELAQAAELAEAEAAPEEIVQNRADFTADEEAAASMGL
jgi:hypothetical protein